MVCVAAVSSDGVRVSWKDNFESFYTEVAELGRYEPPPETSTKKLIKI